MVLKHFSLPVEHFKANLLEEDTKTLKFILGDLKPF